MPVSGALEVETRGALEVLTLRDVRAIGVDAFITTRHGGVSLAPYDTLNLGDHVGDDPARVEENRRRVAEALEITRERLVILRQVHGQRVLDADGAHGAEADALTTTRDDLALAILVADCVPLLLADDTRVSVVHAGWRGLQAGVIANALASFHDASRVKAFVGPHVSGARYQVGPDVAQHFADVAGAVAPDEGDRSRLDLGVIARHQLLAGGVTSEHVYQSGRSTDETDYFFSDRSERPCGRFALVARRRAVA